MKYSRQIYNMVLNEQGPLLELLEKFGIGHEDAKEKIKEMLDGDLYEIVETSKDGIEGIKKKSTGEVFRKGDTFFHKKYGKWIENIYFDGSLSGIYYGDTFYKNYVRANGGLYHLDEMTLGTEFLITD